MNAITLGPIQAISGNVQLPGSKSLSNRALLLAALAEGTTIIDNLLVSDDVTHMRDALRVMGIEIRDQGESLIVQGCGGDYLAVGGELFLGNSGTSMRSLVGAATLGHGTFVLDGVPRMRERPIGDLVDGLRQLGAEIEYLNEEGFPPLKVIAKGLAGGTARVSGAISSQFLSAMLMAAPLAQNDVCLHIEDTLVSAPYVDMTLKLMSRFGAESEHKRSRLQGAR
jgi:3-phosphoshikimate 1-carboxyvinyltransferase